MQIAHAEWEGRRELIDGRGGNARASDGRVRIGEGRVWGCKVLGEVSKNRDETIVFVQARKSAGSELQGSN